VARSTSVFAVFIFVRMCEARGRGRGRGPACCVLLAVCCVTPTVCCVHCVTPGARARGGAMGSDGGPWAMGAPRPQGVERGCAGSRPSSRRKQEEGTTCWVLGFEMA
jgi:hypothetical protein